MSKQTIARGTLCSAELALQLVHRIDRALVRLEGRSLLLLEQVPRVLVRELDELAARAALRHPDRDARQRLLDQLAIADLERDEQLLARARRSGMYVRARYAASTASSPSS